MIDSRHFRWATAFSLLTISMMGQRVPSNDVPLKNWAAPLFWLPNQGERDALRESAAQFQLSPNATSTTALVFVAVSPCRLVDTRGASAGFIGSTPFNGPYIPAGGTVTFPVQSSTETSTTAPSPCGAIPSIAQAYSLNLTILPHPLGTPVNYVTMWPAGVTIPQVSTLNDQQGAVAANAAIVPAGSPSGGINVFAYGPADVIIDLNGFYAAPTDSVANTAVGALTLSNLTIGYQNTAIGYSALRANTTGAYNTAVGDGSLTSSTTGNENSAYGASSLLSNTSGNYNTATGYGTLIDNTTGTSNTATGWLSLSANSTGAYNVATGAQALLYNTGSYNTSTGGDSMSVSTTGIFNEADGYQALVANTTGSQNTADGAGALASNTTGTNNIGIGFNAGKGAPAGNSNSIYIGSQGFSYDASVIRLGEEGTQSATFIGGIYGNTVGGSPVYVNNVGQLSTSPSSRRFKEQITDMGDASSKLFQLRPVTFLYKPEYDDSHLLQYGLIAEEVEKLYPEMVDYDKNGQPHSVKYQFLAPMLLNELQKQAGQIHMLEERLASLEAALAAETAAAKSGGNQ